MNDLRELVLAWSREGALPREHLNEALRIAGVTPSPEQWRAFVERLLLWLGAVLIAAAATYFVAANWHGLGRYAKFALVEGALVAAVAVAWWRGLDSLAGRAALFAAALVTGVLLALVGQVYQTGADTYELFAWWALFIVPWVVVGRQPALWMLLVALIDVAIVLYFRTSVARGVDALDLLFSSQRPLWIVTGFNAIALIAWEAAAAAFGGWCAVRWAPRLLATAVGAALTFLAVRSVFDSWENVRIASLVAYAAFAAAMYLAYRVRTLDLVMLAGLVASAIAFAAFVFGRAVVPSGGIVAFLLIAILIAGSAAGAAHWLRRLASQAREEAQ